MNALPSDATSGKLDLDALRLDPENPRLPEGLKGVDEHELIKFIAEAYNAIEIARSIVRFGYFASEPLIVVKQGDSEYLVVEGNRRLVALKILADPSLASGLDDAKEWEALAKQATLSHKIPAVIAASKQAVAPIIGYRHISGIEPWEPYEKARFIAGLVDKQKLGFEEVANIVGERLTEVAALYRNYAIVKQAQTQLSINTEGVIARFGIFTRAMSSLPLRNFIGAPSPSETSPGIIPVPLDKKDAVKELLSWLFGDETGEKVISESRNITDLGTVIESEDGLQVLRETRNLDAAFITAGGLRDRLLRRLTNAFTNLAAARFDMPAYANDDEAQLLLAQCKEALEQLMESNGKG